MNTMAVTCTNVNKRYGNRVALNHFTVAIPKGRLVGIFGPNGSGKSTLFRTLMGITRPDAGIVQVLGKPPGWQTNAEVAYLPDRARWYENHTVEDAIHWGERLFPSFDYSHAITLADGMGLDRRQSVAGMSRGTEARLMLLMCLARKVPLLILDEPFSGIDLVSRDNIVNALLDYAGDQDSTVLMSTHELADTESIFDYAVFLQHGQVLRAGDVDALRQEYGSMQDMMRILYRDEVAHP